MAYDDGQYRSGGMSDHEAANLAQPPYSDQNWHQLENLADTILSGEYPADFGYASQSYSTFRVVKINQGGQYDPQGRSCHYTMSMADYRREDPQVGEILRSEDNGFTLVVFTGQGTVCLSPTHDGRSFGASVLAPRASVRVSQALGYVDGGIAALNLYVEGDKTQLHADWYLGPMICKTSPYCPEDEGFIPTPEQEYINAVFGGQSTNLDRSVPNYVSHVKPTRQNLHYEVGGYEH